MRVVLAGVDALLSVVRNEPVELPSPRSESYESGSPGIGTVLMSLLGAIPVGLGSIVGFRKWRRHRRRRCPACQTLMVCLAEADDDALLEKGQQAEERVGSVDYDVWKCGACSHHFTLRYPKWVSGFAKCPQCHNRTKSSTETVIEPASTTQQRQRARRRAVRVLQLPPRVHEGPSAHRVELLFVERFVEQRFQQFRRRQLGRRRSQQGILETKNEERKTNLRAHLKSEDGDARSGEVRQVCHCGLTGL